MADNYMLQHKGDKLAQNGKSILRYFGISHKSVKSLEHASEM